MICPPGNFCLAAGRDSHQGVTPSPSDKHHNPNKIQKIEAKAGGLARFMQIKGRCMAALNAARR